MSKPSEAPATVGYRYKFEDVEFDETAALLKVDGQAVSLEPRPMRLLAELLHHLNEVVTRDELFESVWDGRPTVDGVLANAVNKLRKALGEPAAARVVTVPRIGYRFVGPVERVAEHIVAAPMPDLQAGQAVPGREGWRLERPLGTGTRGHVWLARQAKIGTPRVFKFAADADSLRALKREYTLCRVLREELGEREDFAQLVDCNFAAPPFFIECEYGGEDLAAWAGEHLAGLDLRQRLALFLQVAQAVAAAHRVGVLHKDLKPANILVSPEPARGWRARLIDFGSGRVLDLERLRELQLSMQGLTLTQHLSSDALTGTPLYLAPELLAGEAPSMQSDLYALGLILFQLLAGDLRRPLSTGWQRDVPDALLQQDITAATEGRPQDRPASVQAWADGLTALGRRQAEHLAEQAREAEHLRLIAAARHRQARRPWMIGAVAALCLGLLVSTILGLQASQARSAAETESTRAKAINDFLNEDILTAADVLREGANKPATMLEVMRKSSERAAARFRTQPLAESAVRHQLARVFQRLASTADAVREYEKAIALRQPLVAPDDEQLLTMQLEQVRQEFRGNPDAPDGTRLWADLQRQAGAAALQAPNLNGMLAALLRAELLMGHGNWTDALPQAQRAKTLSDSLAVDQSMRLEISHAVLAAYVGLDDVDKAMDTYRAMAGNQQNLDRVTAIGLARASMVIGHTHREAGRLAAAQTVLLDAIARLSKAEEPSELHLGDLESDLGHGYNMQGDFRQAAQRYRNAITWFSRSMGEEHQYTQVTVLNLAGMLTEQQDFEQALKLLLKHRPWFNAHARGGRYIPLEYYLARALMGLGQQAEALRVFESLPRPQGDSYRKGDNESLWYAEGWRGILLIQMGRKAEGERLLKHAYEGTKASSMPPWSLIAFKRQLDALSLKQT